MIINDVAIVLQPTTLSSRYCHEWAYHNHNSQHSWTEIGRQYHSEQLKIYLDLFNISFIAEYPMFEGYDFSPAQVQGNYCSIIHYKITNVSFQEKKTLDKQ